MTITLHMLYPELITFLLANRVDFLGVSCASSLANDNVLAGVLVHPFSSISVLLTDELIVFDIARV